MFIFRIIYHVAVVIKIYESPNRQEKLQQYPDEQKDEERLLATLRWKSHRDEDRVWPGVARWHPRRSQAGLVRVDHDVEEWWKRALACITSHLPLSRCSLRGQSFGFFTSGFAKRVNHIFLFISSYIRIYSLFSQSNYHRKADFKLCGW